MNKYLKSDEWCIIEEGFEPKNHKASESIFSLGNGHMGQRANFEERYSGKSLQGSYIAGIYYPDKTRVGWWKNGYPEYFAKVLNSPNWIGIDVQVNENYLDLSKCPVGQFIRTLNMKEGFLSRSFIASMPEGPKIKVESIRFLSMANPEIGAIKYSVTPINENIELTFTPYIDGDVKNEDSNYNEKFWNILETESDAGESLLIAQTKKLEFHAAYRMKYNLALNGQPFQVSPDVIKDNKLVGNKIKFKVEKGQTATIYKYVSVVTSLNYPVETLKHRSEEVLDIACKTGFETLFDEHKTKWAETGAIAI